MVSTISTTLPKIPTILNLSKSIEIKPIPTPSVFYSNPVNQVQISSQIQEARNVISKTGASQGSVLPVGVVDSTIKKVSDTGIKSPSPIVVPVPSGQGTGGGRSGGNSTTVIRSTEVKSIVTESPKFDPFLIPYANAQQGISDFGESISGALDKGKNMLLIAGGIAAFIFLSTRK